MRTLVTGGAGFIGSHLVDALAARGDAVTALDDLSRGQRARLNPEAALVVADVRDADAVAAAFADARPEICFHLAAQADVRVSVSRPAYDAEINVLGSINVLQAALEHGTRVVLASTGGAIYGDEVATIPSPESAVAHPEAPYGTAKKAAEEYVACYRRLHGVPHAALRLANVYGPRQDPHGEAGVVSIFVGRVHEGRPVTIFGDGEQTRDYVHVLDVVQAFLLASGMPDGGMWNIGTGEETSVLDLARRCAALGDGVEVEHAPARPGELARSALDASRARAELGWSPQRDLDRGLRDVWDWVAAGEPAR